MQNVEDCMDSMVGNNGGFPNCLVYLGCCIAACSCWELFAH